MSLIKDYEQQYAVLTAEIMAQISRIAIYTGGECKNRRMRWGAKLICLHFFIVLFSAERRELVSKVDTNLSEAKELVSDLSCSLIVSGRDFVITWYYLEGASSKGKFSFGSRLLSLINITAEDAKCLYSDLPLHS